ncbi:TPA: HAMP domain-containing histidine kinase [Clostridioides difficile]|uniref:sensor histidine kinase n=1 Tax=Clostridioides difficile TaxID=1496 RepID=UPI0009774755|nr:HAMP domain-containing sensor histidine kinase [Clostridioides difficile]EGT3782895.1 HAMP domain-containing histidine kinase [Clostridioides difficile]EGT5072458.1 sensor histidine kinase [Clostridioides difficile]ELX4517739.1 HAMP domain-containing histidine kinase [Clostridioides difficile]ELX4518505.1 HAMP domain-containing histidine kinase [Clostridioides difficile]MCZ1024412.1 HAMP domain-containing sensor histidine kinase [Clostridioides difficile]
MKTPRNINSTVVFIIFCLIVTFLLSVILTTITSFNEYNVLSKALGASYEYNPKSTESILKSLKNSSDKDFKTGNEILSKHGYSKSTFWSKNFFYFLVISFGIISTMATVVYIIKHRTNKQKLSRINNLTQYLEEVNLGKESVLLRCEDEFSHLEDEIYKTVGELRCSKEFALKERQTLSDNLADIAHQLKTPITSMSLMAQLLSENCPDEEIDYINRLTNQISRLERLVSSLLTLSKLDASTLIFESKLIDVHSLLTYAIEPIEASLREKHQTFTIEASPSVEFEIDINWTLEALLNILKNCSEHIEDGGYIVAYYSQNPLYVEIIIEDNGKGFAQEELPYIFNRFYRGKNASKDSIGIGLALSKSIIERQNGTLHAENCHNGGARFIIKFYT